MLLDSGIIQSFMNFELMPRLVDSKRHSSILLIFGSIYPNPIHDHL